MRILLGIAHPAHVHHFKHFIRQIEERGHRVLIVAVDKDNSTYLLETYGFNHVVIGKDRAGLFNKAIDMIKMDKKVYDIAKKFEPDIFIGRASTALAHVSTILRKPYISFSDTEHARLIWLLTRPFMDVICTPSCFKKDLGKRQVRYNGYHELAYLHPNYFKPDPSVLGEIGLTEGDRFFIVRFVSWQASHDIGQHGFGLQIKRRLVAELGKYGRVLVTSEGLLPEEFEKYRITLPVEKLHDLLYYATLYIGEGATIASECAVLGTPAIYVNTLRLGYLDEEEAKYGLVYNFSEPDVAQEQVIEKAVELLQRGHLKEEWQAKRERLLRDKVDVTKFMVELVENYS